MLFRSPFVIPYLTQKFPTSCCGGLYSLWLVAGSKECQITGCNCKSGELIPAVAVNSNCEIICMHDAHVTSPSQEPQSNRDMPAGHIVDGLVYGSSVIAVIATLREV